MKNSVRLGRIAGVEVGLHWSLLVIGALLAAGLAGGRFPSDARGYSDVAYAIAGVVTAVAFLAAVLAHEVSHAVVARREGVRVDGITLWLLGGMTRMHDEAPTPRAELWISGSGPLVSLVIGVVLAGVAGIAHAVAAPALVVAVLWWLGAINVVLAVFNVLPGAPLDGGRLLHAFLWARHGDRVRATETASRAGQVLGWILIGFGFVEFAAGTGLGGGLWLALLGWFLVAAARAEEQRAQVQEMLAGRTVSDVMTHHPVVVPAWISAREFVDHYLLGHHHSGFPVVDAQGDAVGVVTLARVRAVPPDRRASSVVGEIAWPVRDVPTARPDEPAPVLVDRIGTGAEGRLLVLDGGRVAGIVTAGDLDRLVQRRAGVWG
ncbi:MAG TPA: site-2 protease family protein [Acidimicrobiia bacterium]|nr:site-2 protease family protein [Acidimicrobiia bacterium]